MRRRIGGFSVLVLAAWVGGCAEPPDDQRTDTLDPNAPARAALPAGALAQLDSGNAAYRAATYEQALRHFQRVVDEAPDQPTGWFGLYMAHHALGNLAAADSALDRAREVAPGASLIRPGPDDTLPEGGGEP